MAHHRMLCSDSRDGGIDVIHSEGVTTWRDVYVDVPVPVVRRDHVDVDVPQWSRRDWHTVVDVPQLTWTRETLVVTLPAVAVSSPGP